MYWPIDELVAAGTFKTFLSDLIALISYSRYPGLPPLLVWQQLFALLAPLPDEYPVECNATGDGIDGMRTMNDQGIGCFSYIFQ